MIYFLKEISSWNLSAICFAMLKTRKEARDTYPWYQWAKTYRSSSWVSYLSFSNSVNKVSERCPLNCTPVRVLHVQSASGSLQQCVKQAPFSACLPPYSLLLQVSLSPPSLAHRKVSRITLSQALLHRLGCALWQAKAGLCAWTRLCPRRAAAAAWNTARSQKLSSIVFPSLFFFFFLPKIAVRQEVWEAQFYLVKSVWNQMFSVV